MARPEEHDRPARAPAANRFPIIGIGASAGGLEAVKEMLAEADENLGMAFVLVQHLDPNHESMMAELIGKKTELPVRQIRNDEAIHPNNVYVIPPGFALGIEDGRLILNEFAEPRGMRRPIDEFFISLARQQGDNSVCVVLSGTGADGSAGLRAVKDEGGICIAQEPETASYDGMPTAAIGTGLVDFVLPPERIIERIRTFFEYRDRTPAHEGASEVADHVDEMCKAVQQVVGHDFAGYKRATLIRRIERRMQVLGITEAEAYLERIRNDDDECTKLFKDLLINVTSFFRDSEPFELLHKLVVEPIVHSTPDGGDIRVWVPGCSSGEEAYSLAMLFAYAMRDRERKPILQLFATDIDDRMLAIARDGRYPLSAIRDVPAWLRETYTIGLDGQFQVVPRIRDTIRFSNHSLIKDPPFSRLDLVSCRNLLIYLGDKIQTALLPLFHYALKPGGFLFLGPSEGISRREDLFSPIDQKSRIFKRRDSGVSQPIELPIGAQRTARKRRPLNLAAGIDAATTPSAGDAEATRRILERYAPPHVVLDDTGEILNSYGNLSRYLGFAQGEPSTQVSVLARRGLREILPAMLREAIADGKRRVVENVVIQSEFGEQVADVVVDPLADSTLLVLFVDKERFRQELKDDVVEPAQPDERIYALEEELRQARFRLRATVEELETANEELKSSNEEMMSMNEELQSANEELSTVNEELKTKVDEVGVANDDLKNFLSSTRLAVIVVDTALKIRMFTDEARTVYSLQPADRGRPLNEVAPRVRDQRIIEDVRHVIATGDKVERLVRGADGTVYYALRVVPYTAVGGAIEGATLTFSDVTDVKRLEMSHRRNVERLELALNVGGMGVWEYDARKDDFVVDDETQAGPVAQECMRLEDFVARIEADDRSVFQEAIEATKNGGTDLNVTFRLSGPDESPRWIKMVGKAVRDGQRLTRMAGVFYDISREVEVGETRELLLHEMNHRVKNLFAVISSMLSLASNENLSPQEFASSIRDRIMSLARAHAVTQDSRDAEDIPLSMLLKAVLDAHFDGGAISLKGPDVSLKAKMVTPLGLIIHELATNSVKYGSLSADDGKLEIAWTREPDADKETVLIHWLESGGPPVAAERTEPGFGSRLVELSARQLRGSVRRDWRAEGLRATISLSQPSKPTAGA